MKQILRLVGTRGRFKEALHDIEEVLGGAIYAAEERIGSLKGCREEMGLDNMVKSQLLSLKEIGRLRYSIEEAGFALKKGEEELTVKRVNALLDTFVRDISKMKNVAAEQAIIALQTVFEEFLRNFLNKCLQENDVQLMKARLGDLTGEDVLGSVDREAAKERVRLYWSSHLLYAKRIEGTIDYIRKDLKFNAQLNSRMQEFLLVRNYLVHKSTESREKLSKSFTDRYPLSKNIILEREDYFRFRRAVDKLVESLMKQFSLKYPKS